MQITYIPDESANSRSAFKWSIYDVRPVGHLIASATEERNLPIRTLLLFIPNDSNANVVALF